MLLACDRLKNPDDSIPRIAASLGYESESAFGKAFKRVVGCSPRQHSRQSTPSRGYDILSFHTIDGTPL
jgi:AraC-like DNA-binding protein